MVYRGRDCMHVLKEKKKLIGPTTYRTPPHETMGLWPFASEKEKTIRDVIDEYGFAFYRRMLPQMSVWENTKALLSWDWTGDFFRRYMLVAESHGPYTSDDFSSIWEPRMSAYYAPDLLKKMLGTLAEMYMDGEIPEVLYNPAGVILDERSPIDKAFTALKEGAGSALKGTFWYIVIGGVVIVGSYAYMSKSQRKAA